MSAKAEGRIEAGLLLSASNWDVFLEAAMIYTNLKEYELVIKGTNDPNFLKIAWNNQGLVYALMDKFDKAIECYKKSIEYF